MVISLPVDDYQQCSFNSLTTTCITAMVVFLLFELCLHVLKEEWKKEVRKEGRNVVV
jgi:hypothetical protein